MRSALPGRVALALPVFALSLLALSGLAPSSRVHAQAVEVEELRGEYKSCRAIVDSAKRLECYDALHAKLEPPSFKGWHTEETAPFKIEGPTLLRYQSDGPIFVMYLEDESGAVVQNLHIGGGGEATFLVTRPGTYRLQVNGTDTWRIWIEPQAPARAPRG